MPVEVAVFCRNEEARVRGGLVVLRQQAAQLSPRFLPLRVLVLDNGSTDRTAEVASAVARELAMPGQMEVDVLSALPAGKARAWNTFVARATSDLIAFVDADVDLAPLALERLFERLEKAPQLALAGAVPRLAPHFVPVGFWQSVFAVPYRDLRPAPSIGGIAYAARRDALSPLPEDAINEDLVLSLRHARACAFVADAQAYLVPPASLAGFLRQRARILRGDRLEARRSTANIAPHRRSRLADVAAFYRAAGVTKLAAFLVARTVAEVHARLGRRRVEGWTE